MKNKQFTNADALRLLRKGGETNPSESRVELTRRLLQISEDSVGAFTDWNERLYPKLNDLEDVDLIIAMEKESGIPISDTKMETAPLKTFGDLLLFWEAHLDGVISRRTREAAQFANANCATQTAFYALRRRLFNLGALSSYQAHNLRPDTRFLPLSSAQMETFTHDLWVDYDITNITARFLWGRSVRTDDVQTAFLLLTALGGLIVVLLSGAFMLFNAIVGVLIWIALNVAFAHITARFSQHKLSEPYQTLGDIARKIAESAAPPATAQTAQS